MISLLLSRLLLDYLLVEPYISPHHILYSLFRVVTLRLLSLLNSSAASEYIGNYSYN